MDVSNYEDRVKVIFESNGIDVSDAGYFRKVLNLVKGRCTLLPDFYTQGSFFFQAPASIDVADIKTKWSEHKNLFFVELIRAYQLTNSWEHAELEKEFKEIAAVNQLKPGELMGPLRIMLVGGKFGPGVFEIAAMIGKEQTIRRIENALSLLQ